MNKRLEFCLDRGLAPQIAAHLLACDSAFVPPLSNRVVINEYAHKIAEKAVRFEAWQDGKLVALVAVYCNRGDEKTAFITSVSVLPEWQGRGIASQLVANAVEHAHALGFVRIELEVDNQNNAAASLYRKHGFSTDMASGQTTIMYLAMGNKVQMDNQRDYNIEIKDTADHQYAYSFDFDVMHPYMIRSFEPFFREGSLLELGSFKGDFTRRFLEHFDHVTCVEASGVAIEEAKSKLGDKVTFINSLFETATLPQRYDNIVLTHVLEHLDDPVKVLRRINEEWLAEGGRFFLVCPNANAPSRQIAVKMGLISHNAAVTPAEAEHGHRCTYSLDTLERDAVAAGLKVVHRSGIFFKALANFQWDKLLNTDIISKEYLEGCYQLGQHYPDLCSSIFLMCEQGDRK
jgi:GNAT superfamily N-acetyltransferase/SAM-dependent methyltransferase